MDIEMVVYEMFGPDFDCSMFQDKKFERISRMEGKREIMRILLKDNFEWVCIATKMFEIAMETFYWKDRSTSEEDY